MLAFSALATGLFAGLGLIVAIGAQNAYVLRQGILAKYVALVVGFCIASDVVLMALGTLGVGAATRRLPALVEAVRWLGVAFLLVYAVFAACRALAPAALDAVGAGSGSVRTALATVAALTWLNPHVYLDTMVLLGSLANSHGPVGRWWFTTGSALGSVLWFGALGYGARLLAPWFARPLAWRVLDLGVAVMMAGLALTLGVSG
jgi:L-lysine exporter family protein LysE/ArgO